MAHDFVPDTPQATRTFQTFFNSLPEKLSTTVRIFDRGDFFTVHGADAHIAAQRVFKTTSCIRRFDEGDSQLDYVTLSRRNYECLLRDLLLVQRYRVQVYGSRSGTTASRSTTDWTLVSEASPGNLSQFEDILFGANGSDDCAGGVLSVRVANSSDGQCVGVAAVDTVLQRIQLAEFADSDQLINLESVLVQLSPRECLICPSDSLSDSVRVLMNRNNILVTELKRCDFSSATVQSDLRRLLVSSCRSGRTEGGAVVEERMRAAEALSAAIRYLRLLDKSSRDTAIRSSPPDHDDDVGGDQEPGQQCSQPSSGESGGFTVDVFDLSQYMRLDSAAVSALNLLPSSSSSSSEIGGSLFDVLNQCCTSQGSRQLKQWIKQPLQDIRRIVERQDLVETFSEDSQLRLALAQQHLRQIPDLQRLCKRLHSRRATLQDCYRVYCAVVKLQALIDCLQSNESAHSATLHAHFTQPLSKCMQDFRRFVEMVESTVDMNNADRGVFTVKPDFDEDLQDLYSTMCDAENQMADLLNTAASSLGLEPNKSVKLESTPQMGHYYRITRKEEKVLRNNKHYRLLETNKTGVKFRCERLSRLNDRHMTAGRQYAEQQKSVVAEIVSVAAGYVEPIRILNETLAQLDALVAMATAGVSAPVIYVRPRFVPSNTDCGVTRLGQLRHACVERQPAVSFIANDVQFEHGKSTFKVITGPNMAGKSTYIRSVGVAIVMAHIGCFVPCDEAEVCVTDAVMTRVGAADCQMRGVSTFMSEMLETAAILRSASANSMIIIDELGRGTSTYDGFGLAWAISEHIASKIGAFTLFATHFHELSQLAAQHPAVANLHVTALVENSRSDVAGQAGAAKRARKNSGGGGKNLTFLYRVEAGVCDQSFGIHVAEMVDFPAEVICDARSRAAQLEDWWCSGSEVGGGLDDDEGRCGEVAQLSDKQRQCGLDRIEQFLTEYSALLADCSSVGDQSSEDHLSDLDRKMIAKIENVRQLNDPYITRVLNRRGLQ